MKRRIFHFSLFPGSSSSSLKQRHRKNGRRSLLWSCFVSPSSTEGFWFLPIKGLQQRKKNHFGAIPHWVSSQAAFRNHFSSVKFSSTTNPLLYKRPEVFTKISPSIFHQDTLGISSVSSETSIERCCSWRLLADEKRWSTLSLPLLGWNQRRAPAQQITAGRGWGQRTIPRRGVPPAPWSPEGCAKPPHVYIRQKKKKNANVRRKTWMNDLGKVFETLFCNRCK